MQKKYKGNLANALLFMQKGRVHLYTPFLKHDALTIVGPSFKYENNQAAFDLVREQYFTLWIDSLFIKLNENEDLDVESRNFILSSIEKLFELMYDSNKSTPAFELQLIHTKEKAIKQLLNKATDMDKKMNELKYAYAKDKALFERKFREYDIEQNNN